MVDLQSFITIYSHWLSARQWVEKQELTPEERRWFNQLDILKRNTWQLLPEARRRTITSALVSRGVLPPQVLDTLTIYSIQA